MEMTLGQRVRHAIDSAGMSVESVATNPDLRISPQALYDWISGKTKDPRRKKLIAFAKITGVDEVWLLSGAGEPRAKGLVGVKVSESSRGRTVPKLSAEQAVQKTARETGTSEETSFANYPCSSEAFSLEITDDSNAPDFSAGDTVIIDPAERPLPGDMVFAAVDKDRRPVFRKYALAHDKGKSTVVLEALNPDWGKHSENIEIIGVMTEHTQPRRRRLRRVS